VDRVGAPLREEEAVRNFSKPRAVEGSVLLFVILSDPERSEGESKEPYSCKKSEFGRLAQQKIRDYWRL
jgi:hypothetical protein